MSDKNVPVRLNLRVLEDFDSQFEVYVARCLETGTVATADSFEEAHKLLMETLRVEVVEASRAEQPLALFIKPADPQFELQWQQLASLTEPKAEMITVLDSPLGARKGVKSELSIRSVKQNIVA